MIYYDSNRVNDWYRSSSAITKMMFNGKQAYRRVTRVLPTRWVTDSTSYLCVSTDKHEKQVKQYSLDDGITWTNYVPEISRPGNIIFSGSVDCGAAPQERWAVDSTSYICDGYDKYEKEVKQYCLDDYGISWANFVPEVSRKGNLIKVNARQCGYTADTQEPCYAVVDVISAYTDNEFEDVYATGNGKWYKRNNLNSYEEYGVYGDSIAQTATTYPGKLAIYDGYEYIYSGNSWQSIGEVSGSTATLPNVPFSLNYNAKNYDSTTHTIAKTTGQLIDMDATAVLGLDNIIDHSDDGYITINGDNYASMKLRNQYDNNYQYLNRSDGEGTGEMTIVSKAKTTNGFSLITNRSNDSCYNWMYRQYDSHLTLHGNSETGQISCSDSSSDVLSVRTYYDNGMYVQYNNWTQDTSTSPQAFSFGCTDNANYTNGALFVGYGYDSSSEWWNGDFYWVYMSQHALTDAEIEQVIAFNEEGTTAVYPKYYDEMQAPPSAVTFSSMTEAEDYECPYVGMDAVISGVDYIFSEEYNWVTKYQWVTVPNDYFCYSGDKYAKEKKQVRNVDETWSDVVPAEYRRGSLIESGSTDCSSRLPSGYVEVEYIQNTSSAYIDTDFTNTVNTDFEIDFQITGSLSEDRKMIGQGFKIGLSQYNGCWRWIDAIWYETGISCDGNRHSAYTDNWNYYIDGTLQGNRYEYRGNGTYPMYLFAASSENSPTPDGDCAHIKLFSCRISDNGTLVRDFVPCVRESDNKAGVYDLVNDVFYTSINPGYDFTAGDPV